MEIAGHKYNKGRNPAFSYVRALIGTKLDPKKMKYILIFLIVMGGSCKTKEKTSGTTWDIINENGELYGEKYGKINFGSDTLIIWEDSLFATYKAGFLQEIGPKKNGQKNGVWYIFSDEA